MTVKELQEEIRKRGLTPVWEVEGYNSYYHDGGIHGRFEDIEEAYNHMVELQESASKDVTFSGHLTSDDLQTDRELEIQHGDKNYKSLRKVYENNDC